MPSDPPADRRHTAIYTRGSTHARHTTGQVPDLKQWADQSGARVVWYRDRPGKDRPAFNRLRERMQAGEVWSIVVWRLDRLGLTTTALARFLTELDDLGIHFVCLRDGIDGLDSRRGRAMLKMLRAVAGYDRRVRSELYTASLKAASARGSRIGRPPGISQPTKVTAEVVEAIAAMHAEGRPAPAIAQATGLTKPTVYSVLERLTGKTASQRAAERAEAARETDGAGR